MYACSYHSYSGLLYRRTKSWSNRISLLEKPWTICPIRWYRRRERPVFGLLGCLDASCFLIHWDWNCCCKYFLDSSLVDFGSIIYSRSLLAKPKIRDATFQRPLKEYTFVSSPSWYTKYVFFILTPRYSSLLHRWYHYHRSFGSVQ